MNERRQSARLKTFKGGMIIYGTAPPVECLIRNLSTNGACLEIGSDGLLPDQFTLLIKPEMVKRNCHMVWRKGHRVGVQFILLASKTP